MSEKRVRTQGCEDLIHMLYRSRAHLSDALTHPDVVAMRPKSTWADIASSILAARGEIDVQLRLLQPDRALESNRQMQVAAEVPRSHRRGVASSGRSW